MKIQKIFIDKFRGFEKVDFELGKNITVIAGQNGTQKTTLLGLLTQPFTITDTSNPMYGEKPLSGENFRSGFSDKFRLSDKFDKIGDHKWTLYFDNNTKYPVGSIDRGNGKIRIWKVNEKTGKKDASKGSGYIQFPIIYLSLKRLLPIGEDSKLKKSSSITLDQEEESFYKNWHDKILILTKEKERAQSSSYILSSEKQTLGANTDYYDWESNSAGQDNIGKILLAILSFRRLQKKYPDNYEGGILAIDEIDTTFYPGSQIKLLEALNFFSSKFNIQIIFTTHSLTLLKKVSEYQEDIHRKDQVKLVYLQKEDQKIVIENNLDYSYIKNKLNKTLTGSITSSKIDVYTEDKETEILSKSFLGTKNTKKLNFIPVHIGCGNLIDLASRKIPAFSFPNSIIILDGDIRKEKKQISRIHRIKNILLLPTEKSPEQIISDYLYYLDDNSSLWKKIDNTFDHEYCFKDITNNEVQTDRVKAKKWFNLHLKIWGRNANKVLNPWKKENKEEVNAFLEEFDNLFNKF